MIYIVDRRVKPRINCDYPAVIGGYDADGYRYKENARLANLSAGGLYMIINRNIECGCALSIKILLARSLLDGDPPKIMANGVVVWTEHRSDGSYGVAVKFTSYQFI